MSIVTLSFPELIDGTTAYGSQVQTNFTEITDVVNGAIDDSNIASGGITASSKLADASVVAAKIADANIRSQHVDWTSANSGVRAWRTNGYAGANGNRLIRIEKTLVGLLANTNEQSFSINWSAGDSPDGNVTFASAPTIVGLTLLDAAGALIDATDALRYIKVGTRSTTGCTVLINFSDAPTAGDTVVLMGMALGAA